MPVGAQLFHTPSALFAYVLACFIGRRVIILVGRTARRVAVAVVAVSLSLVMLAQCAHANYMFAIQLQQLAAVVLLSRPAHYVRRGCAPPEQQHITHYPLPAFVPRWSLQVEAVQRHTTITTLCARFQSGI